MGMELTKPAFGRRDRELGGYVATSVKKIMHGFDRYGALVPYWPVRHRESRLLRRGVAACGWLVVVLFFVAVLTAAAR
jgi:hypothetical protein